MKPTFQPTILNAKYILQKKVSYGLTISDAIRGNLSVYETFRIFNERYKDTLLKVQQLCKQHGHDSTEYKIAKSKLPYFIYSGTFEEGTRYPKDTDIHLNELLTIDIDSKDNPDTDLETVRRTLLEIKGVVGCYRSASGTGIWLLVYIKYPDKYRETYNYISRLLKSKYSINADDKCSNISRKRILGYNPDFCEYTNLDKDIEPFPCYTVTNKEEYQPTTLITRVSLYKNFNNTIDEDKVYRAIKTASDYGYYVDKGTAWYHLAEECKAFGDRGYNLFLRFSNNHPTYRDSIKEIKRKYDTAKPRQIDNDLARKWIGLCKNRGWKICDPNQLPL